MRAPLDLYLASTSPRRRALLEQAGIRFAVCEPGPEYLPGAAGEFVSEPGEPAAHAIERAARKALGAIVPDPRIPVLAVDTVVDLDGEELGKPADREQAEGMLRRLAGRRHAVHTAHCLWLPASGARSEALHSAVVACGPLDTKRLARYLDSGQWRGKAGSYGVQDDTQDFFRLVEGSFDTVVGLHVPAVRALLGQLGRPS
ncbi:MAG: Maf family protein [Planctomycetes bacterium]|nr:Maf family protein [Planctomycetota bacterium]